MSLTLLYKPLFSIVRPHVDLLYGSARECIGGGGGRGGGGVVWGGGGG